MCYSSCEVNKSLAQWKEIPQPKSMLKEELKRND